jgi:excisionase family DNA binding protein
MHTMTREPLLTVDRAAGQLSTSRRFVYRAVNAGRLPSVRLGDGRARIRIDPADLERYISEQRDDVR